MGGRVWVRGGCAGGGCVGRAGAVWVALAAAGQGLNPGDLPRRALPAARLVVRAAVVDHNVCHHLDALLVEHRDSIAQLRLAAKLAVEVVEVAGQVALHRVSNSWED